MNYQKLFDLMSEHGLTLLEGEMDEIIETVNEIQQSLKEQGERSGVRKAEDHLRVYHNWMFRNYETKEVVELMKQYGEQIAFAVRDECSKATDIVIMINISQFIK